MLDVAPAALEPGPLQPKPAGRAVARRGDVFCLGPHRVACGDARDPALLSRLMGEDRARFLFTDQPYNVPIGGHVTGGDHREFVMATGEMSDVEFEAFNAAWIASTHRMSMS